MIRPKLDIFIDPRNVIYVDAKDLFDVKQIKIEAGKIESGISRGKKSVVMKMGTPKISPLNRMRAVKAVKLALESPNIASDKTLVANIKGGLKIQYTNPSIKKVYEDLILDDSIKASQIRTEN